MKSLKAYLIIAGVLLILYITAQLNRPKAVDWSYTLSSKDKIPFGSYILNNRLKDIFQNSKIIRFKKAVYNVIAEDSLSNSSYLIICPAAEFTKADYDQLTGYIKKGNEVFIASSYLGKAFDKYLKTDTKADFTFNSSGTSVRFLNPDLNPEKSFAIDKGAGNIYFNKFDTLKAVVIGENNKHKANFIKYNIGKGSLFLMTNPKFFSNYSLLKPAGADYAAIALSFLKGTKQLAVDEYYTQGNDEQESPMRLFLSNPVLQWAYYITLFSLLLFVLFEMKRRQRIIPVVEPMVNSSLDFVNVVGQVYYEKHDNADIAFKSILYFLSVLRDRYQLKTNNLDSEFTEKLAAKTNVDAAFISALVNYINMLQVKQRIIDRELIELNKLIEQFYIKSR